MKFSKMHGLGNDFIMVEESQLPVKQYGPTAERLCDRHLGIGADGLIIIVPSIRADIQMRIFNSDGSEAEMCGNGIRCFAKYVFEKGIVPKERFTVETLAGIMEPELNVGNDQVAAVKVNMGKPILERGKIPMAGPEGSVLLEPIDVNGRRVEVSSMLMGVPHTMIFVDDVSKADIEGLGPLIEKHPAFPKKTNVNFVEVLASDAIKVRTWERGAGRTLACGTGSCASVVAAALNGKTGRKVTVHLEVGDLFIEWQEDGTVFMTGPAEEVFAGEVQLS